MVSNDRRVLIVDDELMILEFVSSLLASEGYDLDVVHNGSEAVSALLKKKYDVLLTDLIMPHGAGEELIEALTVSNAFPNLKIVVMSGNVLEESLGKAKISGYLSKPFSPEELLKVLEDALRKE